MELPGQRFFYDALTLNFKHIIKDNFMAEFYKYKYCGTFKFY